MTVSSKPKRRRVFFLSATALTVVAAVGAWLILRQQERPADLDAEERLAPPAQAARRPLPPARPAQAPPPATRARPLEYASDGLPYMPPGPNDPRPDTFAHPHPITPEHKRIYAENALLYQLNEAMDGKEVPRLRKLLKEYKEQYPEDPHEMQGGYALIADCQEHPGDPAIRAAAQRYFDTEIASTLRRFVLRHCLGPPN